MYIFLDKTVSVYRLQDLGGNKQGYTTFTTTLEACIQPLGDEKTAMAGGSYGKMFKIYIDVDTNLKEGDKLKDKDGNLYQIVSGGIENRNDGLIADYMGVTVKKVKKVNFGI